MRMRASFFTMLLLFSCLIMTPNPMANASVRKCYGGQMEEYVCKAPNFEFCLKVECEHGGVFRGCGHGDKEEFEQEFAPKICADIGDGGAYKNESLSMCYEDMCNGDSGNSFNQTAGVSKCYNLNMTEQVCQAPSIGLCYNLDCEKGVARGCAYGDENVFETLAPKLCAQIGYGAYKNGSVSTCVEDMCNGASGN